MADDREDHAPTTSSPIPPGPVTQEATPSQSPITAKDPSSAEQAQSNQDAALASGAENVV
jgi:hypothetical protein